MHRVACIVLVFAQLGMAQVADQDLMAWWACLLTVVASETTRA